MIRMKRIASFDNPEQAFLFCKDKNKGQQNPKYLTFKINKKTIYCTENVIANRENRNARKKAESS